MSLYFSNLVNDSIDLSIGILKDFLCTFESDILENGNNLYIEELFLAKLVEA